MFIKRSPLLFSFREVDIFFDEEISVQTIIGRNKSYCKDIQILVDHHSQFQLSFALRKGYFLSQEISNSVFKMIENGAVDELIERWFYIPNCKAHDHQNFPLTYFGGLITIIGICLVINIFINLLENYYTYKKTTKESWDINNDLGN